MYFIIFEPNGTIGSISTYNSLAEQIGQSFPNVSIIEIQSFGILCDIPQEASIREMENKFGVEIEKNMSYKKLNQTGNKRYIIQPKHLKTTSKPGRASLNELKDYTEQLKHKVLSFVEGIVVINQLNLTQSLLVEIPNSINIDTVAKELDVKVELYVPQPIILEGKSSDLGRWFPDLV